MAYSGFRTILHSERCRYSDNLEHATKPVEAPCSLLQADSDVMMLFQLQESVLGSALARDGSCSHAARQEPERIRARGL